MTQTKEQLKTSIINNLNKLEAIIENESDQSKIKQILLIKIKLKGI